tara:strand:- start:10922 stop:13150 length:2229 start_codon:yes stop_codon:yes gene_type:complete
MNEKRSKIIYTKTDEAPMLATYSLFPIVNAFVKSAGIDLIIKDISLSARILSEFSEYLGKDQRIDNDLDELGEMVKNSESNIIKLPNISASVPQLNAAIKELQSNGFDIPDYPDSPENFEEDQVKLKYNKVKGSAVNPILREGNSDRRAPKSVKNHVKLNPHRMGEWSPNSRTHVSTMDDGDFFHNEQSICVDDTKELQIQFVSDDGEVTILRDKILLMPNEIIDASVMNKNALISFFKKEFKDANDSNILLSLHLKSTMMKVSDPIIFSHAVQVYFSDLLSKYHKIFDEIGVDFKNGFGDLINKIQRLDKCKIKEIHNDIERVFQNNAKLAMVDSEKGITNLHVPSDVIIDASMPAMIRNSGKMWNKYNNIEDTKAVIPDSSYSSVYKATIEFCKKNGAFDPSKMGTVPNVGLMAQKAEEYGSHDKTFEMFSDGKVNVIDSSGNILIQHKVNNGDIWRMCQTKEEPINDWIKLAINRSKSTGWPSVFWLDENRSHDFEIIKKVKKYLEKIDLTGIDIRILDPYEATNFTLNRIKNGKNTISVTGNVLRDYLTDLFPILELGTSAKMLSIVPLMNGGSLFETGAGGSAPKHVQQLIFEGHLRWDSLGEFLALIESLRFSFNKDNNHKARVLADSLELATEKLLKNDKSPKRKVGELDSRGSHFYLSMYWAQELSIQDDDQALKLIFSDIYEKLKSSEKNILNELDKCQGRKNNINGYYYPDLKLLSKVMRPSETFNKIIDSI